MDYILVTEQFGIIPALGLLTSKVMLIFPTTLGLKLPLIMPGLSPNPTAQILMNPTLAVSSTTQAQFKLKQGH